MKHSSRDYLIGVLMLTLAVFFLFSCATQSKTPQTEGTAEQAKPALEPTAKSREATPSPSPPPSPAPQPSAPAQPSPTAQPSPPAQPSSSPSKTPEVTQAPAQGITETIPASVNLRKEPSMRGKIIRVLKKGTKLTVFEEKEGWLHVRLEDGAEGWVGKSMTSFALLALPEAAENFARGTLVVDGQSVDITQVYAYAQPGFFDKKKQDVVVLLCDAPVPGPAVRDQFARQELVDAGKLHCVQQTINTEKQVINYEVRHKRFGMPQGGGSSYHVFEAKTFDDKTIAGRARTTSPQKSFKDVTYSYDITFSTAFKPLPSEKAGKKLPAGGGELGKAYLAHNRKILSMDIAEIRKAAPPGELDKTSDDELRAMLALAVAMTPKDVEITEGYVNGEQGLLYVIGIFDKEKKYGTVEMARKDGEWVVVNQTWEDTPPTRQK